MIRVLHYGLSSNRGGIETYLYKILTHIDKSSFQFDFLDTNEIDVCFYDEFTKMGSQFYKITPRSKSIMQNKKDLEALFRKEKFDIFHCHLNTLSYIEPIFIALKYGSKVILHSRSAGASKSIITNLLHYINFLKLPRERLKLVAVSQLAGNWLFGRGSNFEIINNGIEINKYEFSGEKRYLIRKEMNVEEKFVVGNIGAFLYAKNHKFIINVFQKIVHKKPNAVLYLVGVGPLREEVINLVAQLGLQNKVFFLGKRSDIPELLSAMDCFLFPSFYEGFPNAVLEAQCSGLQCIISNEITNEIVVEDYCERLPLSESSEQWAESIILKCSKQNDRKIASSKVEKAGFSVIEEIKRLETIYLDTL
ncbi:glycosyltransferase [Bacillus sp. DJP31]|uniref:glycosyltransferase n=1 Tax=Bacillus sp. DJP31 TaxID=3409789 RepID=UPI003BB72895